MAKAKETKAATTAEADGENKPKAPKAAIERGTNDIFVRVYEGSKPKEVAKETKLAPQAQTILNAIEAAGKGGIKRPDLVKNLKGVLVTKQPEGRILSYYTKDLLATGCVTLTKGNAPAAEKPAPKSE